MKKIILLGTAALFIISCGNSDEQIQKELDPMLTTVESKLDAWCNCVSDCTRVNDCVPLGKEANAEREKYMAALEKNKKEHGADNKVVLKYQGANQNIGVKQAECNGKFLERGGEQYW